MVIVFDENVDKRDLERANFGADKERTDNIWQLGLFHSSRLMEWSVLKVASICVQRDAATIRFIDLHSEWYPAAESMET